MAGSSAVIGALRVVLGADTAAFDKGLKDAEKTLASFSANMAKVGLAMGAGIAAAATALGVSIKHAIDQADKMGKMAQQFGIPVEELSKLKLAADLSGVSIEEVGKAVGRMSKSMSEIAGGKQAGGAAEAFKALHITVTGAGGALKSSTQIMEEVADKFATMKDGAGKTALAISIFGRAGAALIPLLNQGSAALREAAKEAEELGIVIDSKTAKAAEGFNDNLTRLGKVKDGIALKITEALAPAFQLLTNKLVAYVKENDVARTSATAIIGSFDLVGRVVATVGHIVSSLGREFSALWEVLKAPTFATFSAAWQKFQEEGRKSEAGLAAISNRFQDFREEADMLARNTENVANGFKKVEAPVLASKNALDEFFKSQEKSIAGQRAEAQTVGLLAGARESLKVVLQGQAVAQENQIRLTDAMRARLAALAGEARNAAMTLAGAQMTQDVLTPADQYAIKLKNINDLLLAQKITAETAAEANKKAAEQAGTAWDIAGASIAGSFTDVAKAFSGESSKMAKLAQVFGAVQAIISAYTGAAKALELPFPANIAAAAAVLAKGLVFVASIRSQKIPAMATGGTMIPKAFTGVDSVLMQARIRPDEEVDIVRPGEQRRGERGFGGTIIVRTDELSRPLVEKLVNGINDLMGDRGGIKMATA